MCCFQTVKTYLTGTDLFIQDPSASRKGRWFPPPAESQVCLPKEPGKPALTHQTLRGSPPHSRLSGSCRLCSSPQPLLLTWPPSVFSPGTPACISSTVSCSVESDSLRPPGCSPPGSSVHGILQARTLEWTAIPFTRGSSRPRNQTQVSCIASRFFTACATAGDQCSPPCHLRQLQPWGCLCVLSAHYSPSYCPKYIINSSALKIAHCFPFY